MMTWFLWAALQRPYTQHPLFRQMLIRHQRRQQLKWRDIIPIPRFIMKNDLWGALWGMAAILLLCSGGWLIIVPIIVLTPVAMIGAGTAQGAYAAVRVGTTLAREREQGHTLLTGVMPSGTVGASWAVCSFVHHTNRPVTQMRETVRGVHIALFIGIGFITAIAALNWIFTRDLTLSDQPDLSTQNLLEVIRLFLLLVALYVDFIQSTVLGSLIGMLTPTFTRSRVDAGGLAFGAFMALQLSIYAGVFVVVLVILPALIADPLNPALFLTQFAIYYFSREFIILSLWRITAQRLQSDPDELRRVINLRQRRH